MRKYRPIHYFELDYQHNFNISSIAMSEYAVRLQAAYIEAAFYGDLGLAGAFAELLKREMGK